MKMNEIFNLVWGDEKSMDLHETCLKEDCECLWKKPKGIILREEIRAAVSNERVPEKAAVIVGNIALIGDEPCEYAPGLISIKGELVFATSDVPDGTPRYIRLSEISDITIFAQKRDDMR